MSLAKSDAQKSRPFVSGSSTGHLFLPFSFQLESVGMIIYFESRMGHDLACHSNGKTCSCLRVQSNRQA